MPIDDVRLSWLAGFMDGEGSFFVSRTSVNRRDKTYLSYRPRVFACNTHRPTMELVEELLGRYGKVQVTIKTNKHKGGTTRDVIHVNLVSWEGCRDACAELVPYLVTKKSQADLLLDWANYRLKLYEAKGKFGAGFSDADHSWYEKLRVLNARGGSEYYDR